MKNNKPVIFISHIHEAEQLAKTLKMMISEIFPYSLEIFVSSDESSISLGDEWAKKIDGNLRTCDMMLILCSSQSLTRPWIGFEAGVGWAKEIKVIPLCYNGLAIKDLPSPFNRWQGANLNRQDSISKLIKQIANRYELPLNESTSLPTISSYHNIIKEL